MKVLFQNFSTTECDKNDHLQFNFKKSQDSFAIFVLYFKYEN
jgi:hypothetical protein